MAVKLFTSAINPILKDSGLINNGGYVYFYEPDTAYATAKAVYSDKTLTTSLGSQVTLTSAATKTIFLNGNYDIKIYDSSLSLIRTIDDINPDATSTANEANLIINGSFEENTSNVPDDWTLFEWNSSANVVDSTDQSHGTYSMKFVSTGSGGGHITTNSFFAVSPNQPVEVTFQLKSTADVRNIVQLLWYDASQVAHGSTPSTSIYDEATSNPTSWEKKYAAALPPSGAYWAKLRVIGCDSSDATSGTARFDGITVATPTDQGEGSSVASAATTNIWGAGLVRHVTGTTSITSFGTAPYAGAVRIVIFDGALTLTHGANLNIPGAANITTATGDSCLVYADTTTQFDVLQYTRASGMPIVAVDQTYVAASAIGQGELKTTTASQTPTVVAGGTNVTLTGGTYSWWTASGSGQNLTLGTSGNVGSGIVTLRCQDGSENAAYVYERYVQASPPYHWDIYVPALMNTDGTINSISVALDPPWAYNGPTDIRAQRRDWASGRTFRKVKAIDGIPLSRLSRNPALLDQYMRSGVPIEETEIELTLDYKDSDKDLVPNPWYLNPLAGRVPVMLCFSEQITQRLHDLVTEADARVALDWIKNAIFVSNTEVIRPGVPIGTAAVMCRPR